MKNIPQIQNIDSNKTRLALEDLVIVYSYQTPIVFYSRNGNYCRENTWSNTTGRHMVAEGFERKDRIPGNEFESKLKEAIENL